MKLSKLYSNNPKFKNIEFNEGLNIIYGIVDKSKEDDPHNLGKSALIHLIDLMLLKEVKKNTYFYNKKSVFSDYTFYLEIKLNSGKYLTIKRSFKNITRVSMKLLNESSNLLDNSEWDHEDIVLNSDSSKKLAAVTILDDLLGFNVLVDYKYRKLLGYFIRTQNDYSDVFQLRKFSSGKDQVWKPFLYELLGFNSEVLVNRYRIINEIDALKTKINSLESYYKSQDIDSINAKIEILEKRKNELNDRIDSFDFYFDEKEINRDLIEKNEKRTRVLNRRRYKIEKDLNLINESLKTEEFYDVEFIKEMFREIELHFSEDLVKSYDELVEFNKSLSVDRRRDLTLLKAKRRSEQRVVESELKELSSARADMISILDDIDVISKYKKLRSQLVEIERSIQELETQKEIMTETLGEIRDLNDKKSELSDINEELNISIEKGNKTLSGIRQLFSDNFKTITDKEGIISLYTNKSSNVEFNAEIQSYIGKQTHEDEGFSYRKMLCMSFDLALLKYYNEASFYRFLYHDGPLESLHSNRINSYFDFIEKYTIDTDVQYIVSMIDSDISESNKKIVDKYKVCTLVQDDTGEGSLFGIRY